MNRHNRATLILALFAALTSNTSLSGAAVAADIIKCQTKPLSAADYAVAFTPLQWARMMAIFPAGVCDWTKSGLEQQPLAGTWQHF